MKRLLFILLFLGSSEVLEAAYFSSNSTATYVHNKDNDGTVSVSTDSPGWEVTDVYVRVGTMAYVNGSSFLVLIDTHPIELEKYDSESSGCEGGCGYAYPGNFTADQFIVPPIDIAISTQANFIPVNHVSLLDGHGRGILPKHGLLGIINGTTGTTYNWTIRTQPAISRPRY